MSVSGVSNQAQIQDILQKIGQMRALANPVTSGIAPGASVKAALETQANNAGGAPSFVAALRNSLDSVNADQNKVTELSQAYEMGSNNIDLTDVMVAVQKANVSFQSAVQVRNRLVSAYHDMMNMQI